MSEVHKLLEQLPQIGRLEWIGLSAARMAPIQPVPGAELIIGHGVKGDHHAKSKFGSKRQVTILQAEHLAAVGSYLGRPPVTPDLLRRNLVVSGLNLLAFKGKTFCIGECLLEFTGPCDPCSRMEDNLGPGGFNAMRGHGGITAKVLRGGIIEIGDVVRDMSRQLTDDPEAATSA